MIVRKDEFRASKAMQNRVLNTPNIEVLFNTETDEILGDKGVEAVRVKNNVTGDLREIAIKGFFVAIGHTPNYLKVELASSSDLSNEIVNVEITKSDYPVNLGKIL